MFSISSLAAAAIAVALGGTGTAAVVMNSPPASIDAGAEITAKANADLAAAEQAQHKAIALLADTSADAQAEAQAQVELASTRLDEASTSMKAAVETGSKAAVDAFGEFTDKSIRLVGNLTTTASVTANASLKAGGDIVKAVDTQIITARGVVATQGDAALSALTQARTNLPATITASVSGGGGGGGTTLSPAVPSTSTGVSVDGSANGSANGSASTTPASASVVGSASGSVSALLGSK